MELIKLIKSDLNTFNKKDLDTLFNYYQININNPKAVNILIEKIYFIGTLPNALQDAIKNNNMEEYKKIIDSMAINTAPNQRYNEPQEVYDIFYEIANDESIDADKKLKYIKYLFPVNWPPVNGKIQLNTDKIQLNPNMNLNIIFLIISRLSNRSIDKPIDKENFLMIFNRVLQKINYNDEKYEMLELIVRFASNLEENSLEMIKTLIKKYPDIDLYQILPIWKDNPNELTLFKLSIMKNDKEIISFLLNNKSDLIHEKGILFGIENPDILKLLIDAGVDINEQDEFQNTYLISLIKSARLYEKGVINLIQILYDTGKLDLNKQDNEGDTALYIASSKYEKVFSLLIDLKADVNIQNKNGWTVLMTVSHGGTFTTQIECFNKLIKLEENIPGSVNFNLKNNNGKTALLVAFIPHKNSIKVFEKLIQYTDLSIQDSIGNTALHLAYDDRILKMLLFKESKEPGVFLEILNNKGENALMTNINKWIENKDKKRYKNIVDLIQAGSPLFDIDINDLIEFYNESKLNLEKYLSIYTKQFNKAELKYFEGKCPNQIYLRKEFLKKEHLEFLMKCNNIAREMLKYKPGSKTVKKLSETYKTHPYFNKT